MAAYRPKSDFLAMQMASPGSFGNGSFDQPSFSTAMESHESTKIVNANEVQAPPAKAPPDGKYGEGAVQQFDLRIVVVLELLLSWKDTKGHVYLSPRGCGRVLYIATAHTVTTAYADAVAASIHIIMRHRFALARIPCTEMQPISILKCPTPERQQRWYPFCHLRLSTTITEICGPDARTSICLHALADVYERGGNGGS